MPSTYTTNLGIELPADGELDGVWGDVVNENMDILDRAINGSIALSLSGTTSTLTTSDGALSDGQYKLLVLGGTPSGTHTITIAPSDAQKIYFVRNTTAQSVVFTQGSGGNVTVATGDSAIIYSDGAGAGAAVVNITNDFAMSSVKITGGTIDGTVIGGTSAAAGTFTTVTGTSFVSSGDMTFGDNDKAIFGAGSDLQIYHDGTNSYIDDQGAGRIIIKGNDDVRIRSGADEEMIVASSNGAVTLYHDSFPKLATTATGVTVTGDVGATTGTFSGDLTIADKIVHSGDTNTAIRFPAADTVTVETSGAERLRVDSSGNVGIGDGKQYFWGTGRTAVQGSSASDIMQFFTASVERARITSAGNVGIGTTSPSQLLHVQSTSGAAGSAVLRLAASGSTSLQVGQEFFSTTTANVTALRSGRIYSAFDGTAYTDARLSFQSMTSGDVLVDTMHLKGGNVGIGTTSPSATLDIEGLGNTVATHIFTSDNVSNATASLVFGTTPGARSKASIQMVNINTGNAEGALAFSTNSGASLIERMRIDGSGNVGVGITNPAYKLVVSAAGASGIELGPAYSGTANLIQHYSRSGGVYVDAVNDAAQHRFNTSGTERMRITSTGNVGIGTSSPANKLDVRTGTTGNIAAFYGTSTYHLAIEEVGGVMFLDANNGSATIGFKTNDTERMRLDSSGTLGLGVTPSAWGSSVKVAQVSNASIAGQSNQALFSNNAFFDGAGWKYISSAVASQYYLDSNARHQWLTAPSGTAGNAITFTQAMTLDASGNLGIGTTSPTADLSVGSITTSSGDVHLRTSKTAVELTPSNSDAGGMDFNVGWVAGGQGPLKFSLGSTERARIDSSGRLGIGATTLDAPLTIKNPGASGDQNILTVQQNGAGTSALAKVVYNQTDDSMKIINASTFAGSYMGFWTSNTERARIDASGNLFVGGTTGTAKLNIENSVSTAYSASNTLAATPVAFFYNPNGTAGTAGTIRLDGGTSGGNAATTISAVHTGSGSSALTFGTRLSNSDVTERARIDAGGNLLVNTTGLDTANGTGVTLQNYANGSYITIAHTTSAGTGEGFMGFYRSSTQIGSITQSGTTGVAYNTTSDYRLKENVQPMQDALAKIAQLNPVTYTWKADGSAGQGFIAHELQAVVPDCVTGEKDAVDETGNPQYQGVDTSFLVATLVKAIQELKAEVDSLRAQLNP